MTITSIKKSKGIKPLVMITAYDALFAKLLEPSSDIILVGDSLNMSFAGKDDTLSATLEQMIYHTKAVCQGAKNSFIICDMPFGTYINKKTALKNSLKVFQETDAHAVKIEGGEDKADIIKHLCLNGIAVCGHIGLLPQSVRGEGGYKIKGKTKNGKLQLIKDAKAVGGNLTEMQDRMLLRFLNETTACKRENVVEGDDLIDAGIIFGTGFAPFRGGPLHYIQSQGAAKLNERLQQLKKQYGDRFISDEAWGTS